MRNVSEEPAGYEIANAEDLNRENPRSFFIPSRGERESLQPGDYAKLLFEITERSAGLPSGERMWVGVTGRDEQGYLGELANDPAAITTVKWGDTVRFGPEHVIAMPGDWPLLDKKILVSRRSHDQDVRPRYVYREPPDNDTDSGWRALVGDETDEEVGDAGYILLQPVGFVLNRWPELRPVFETETERSRWYWDERNQRYAADPAAAAS